ncbi:hypothetical protein [Pseudoalteromonas sp. HF66]|uniref:hypothetical protein n=1 Tax=Pseudoalteromonas sp. HF66 TaxID=2721559 RepID=UPI0014315E3F|nr:hypothetical protein [Pseudoalteromonas sp. HF66]NIZ05170.1 hypothetical protein [Pseudoalteromonas sp. HF66]
MSVNCLDYLEEQIDALDSYLENNDFDSLESGFVELDKKLRNFFEQRENYNEDEVEALRNFYANFQKIIKRTEIKKQALAQQIGSHLRNQKKIDVYKGIK